MQGQIQTSDAHISVVGCVYTANIDWFTHVFFDETLMNFLAMFYVVGLFTGSPLYYAARDDRLKVAKAVLRAGADPERGLLLAEGLVPALASPQGVAAELRHKKMVKLLQESRYRKPEASEMVAASDRAEEERELRRRSI